MNKSMKLIVFLLISTLLFSCHANENRAKDTAEILPPTEESTYIEALDLTYLAIDDMELKLDIAIPAEGEGPFPTIVFIFGGSWTAGGRKMYSDEIRWAAERGFVGVTIDHRLLNKMKEGKPLYPFPAQIHDPKCAVQWLRANAKEYKIDKNRIGSVGFSSGGHLSLLLGLTDPLDGLEGDCGYSDYSSAVQAAVGLAPPIDLIESYATLAGDLQKLLGGSPNEFQEEYIKASPISYVSENDPPITTIMGEVDKFILPVQGELLDAKMSEMGIYHNLIILEGKNHNYFSYNLPELLDLVFDFFSQYL